MNVAKLKLTAKLDTPGGTVILCGRCKADAWAEVDRQEGCVLLAHGYLLSEGGVWRLTRHAAKELRREGRPALHRHVARDRHVEEEIRPRVSNTLPSLLACPWCDRVQWLRSEALGLPEIPGSEEREVQRRKLLAAFPGPPLGGHPLRLDIGKEVS